MSGRSHNRIAAPTGCSLAVGCQGGSQTLPPMRGGRDGRARIMNSKRNSRPITALAGVMALLLSALAANATLGLSAPPAAAASAPTSATDETKVPHYFGPSPNWANSPLTMSTADVKIAGAGAGATAVAQVDPGTGGITQIDVTSPGHDYAADT